jgi:hypothetical protein
MALNRQLYDDLPHGRRQAPKQDPAPHPYKATAPHECWCIDGRNMDVALDGVKWWSLIAPQARGRRGPRGGQWGGAHGPLRGVCALGHPRDPGLGQW